MTVELIQSLTLLAAGALISLGTTLIVEILKARRARVDAEIARRNEAEDGRQAEAKAHTREVFDALNSLWDSTKRRRDGPTRIELTEADEGTIDRVYESYLLIPDAEIRDLIKRSMYGLSNWRDLPAFHVPSIHYSDVLFAIRNSLAAYIRGDDLQAEDIATIRAVDEYLDEKYSWLE